MSDPYIAVMGGRGDSDMTGNIKPAADGCNIKR